MSPTLIRHALGPLLDAERERDGAQVAGRDRQHGRSQGGFRWSSRSLLGLRSVPEFVKRVEVEVTQRDALFRRLALDAAEPAPELVVGRGAQLRTDAVPSGDIDEYEQEVAELLAHSASVPAERSSSSSSATLSSTPTIDGQS